MIQTLEWIGGLDGYLELLDQRRLPNETAKIKCRDIKQLYTAIRTLAVRGAPAIGVAAGFGFSLAFKEMPFKTTLAAAIKKLEKAGEYLSKSRPTAVNLFFAIERILSKAKQFAAAVPNASFKDLRVCVLEEGWAIFNEDVAMCRSIGKNGIQFIKNGDGILTHCNAGALATAGQGTALSLMFEAKKLGRKFKVYFDETRPLLQGARLTMWELKQAGIEAALICDSAAAWLMKQGKINAVFTGADRIAANGDAANKIGTYSLSILARNHRIPFYIAAPSSTFDLTIKNGRQITIEERSPDEVACFAGIRTAPKAVEIYNPAFDITDALCISAIITERGVIRKPDRYKVTKHFKCNAVN